MARGKIWNEDLNQTMPLSPLEKAAAAVPLVEPTVSVPERQRIPELPPKADPLANGKPRKKPDRVPMSRIVKAVAMIDRVLTRLPDDDARRRVLRMANELVSQPTLFKRDMEADDENHQP